VLASATGNFIVSNNTISGTSGAGVWSVLDDTNGSQNIRIQNNTVGDPSQSGPGIMVASGTIGNASFNPTLCSSITGNTVGQGPADGFGNTYPGILLDKASNTSSTYRFGIAGLSPSPATAAQAETSVTSANPNSDVGAGFFAGKRVAVDDGGQVTSCTLPF